MSNIVTQSFHNNVAESVINEIQNNTAQYYYYFGNTFGSPSVPETPLNSPEYIAKTRNNMIMILQVTSSDVSYVVPRVNWASGIRYEKYESSKVGTQTNFYVINDQYNVYKCVDNGETGAVSTVKPTGSDLDIITTGDNYKWKFMYNVPLSLRNKFLSDIYMPVSNALRNRFFSSGEIESVTISDNGAGYVQASTTISITGDGINAAMAPIITSGRLSGVTITNPGEGYTFATITVNSPVATVVAKITANLSNGNISSQQAVVENLATPGTIESISIINGGTGFVGTPTIVITGDGTGAAADVVSVVNGEITRIVMSNTGLNYTYATVTISNPGSATGYVLSANVSPPFGHGRDAVKELYASNLMFYGNMAGTQVAGFDINNDYQQFGLVKNIRTTSFDTYIVDQPSKHKYIILTNNTTASLIAGTSIIANTINAKQFNVTAILGGKLNTWADSFTYAIEVVPVVTGDIPEIGATYQRVTGSEQFNCLGVESHPAIDFKASSLCYIITTTYNMAFFPVDTILTDGANTYIVVMPTTGKIMVQALDGGVISNGITLTKQSDNTKTFVATTVIPPLADKRTGDILTIDNRASFYQSSEQAVSTRTVIRF